MTMQRSEVYYGDILAGVWLLGLARGQSEVSIEDIPEGSIIAVDASHAVCSKVIATYGQSQRTSDIRCAEHFEIAVYGDMFHRGLRADRLVVDIWLPLTGPTPATSFKVSGMAFSRWPESMVTHRVDHGDRCPKCGTRGEFVRTALCCPLHGAFAGF